jgi:hypothetical protein
MNINTEDKIKDLVNENQQLKKRIKLLKKKEKKSISKSEVYDLLQVILPFEGTEEDDALLNYESYLDLFSGKMSFTYFLKLLTTFFKLNREDLSFFFSRYIVEGNYCYKEDEGDIQKELDLFLKAVLFNESPLKSLMFFKVLLFINQSEKEAIGNFLTEEKEKVSRLIITLEDVEFLPMCLALITVSHVKIAYYIFAYMNNHWVVIRDKVIEEKIGLWIVAAKFAGIHPFIEKLNKKQEDFKLMKEGLSITKIQVESALHETHDEESDYAEGWKIKSELRKLGYEVSGKTDRQRQLALHNARKHLSIIKIVNHIEFLLRRSISIHKLGKRDFSRAISAYEMDLQYLQKLFSSHY